MVAAYIGSDYPIHYLFAGVDMDGIETLLIIVGAVFGFVVVVAAINWEKVDEHNDEH